MMRLFNLRFVVTLYSLLNWLAAATNITTTTTNTTNSSFFPNPIYDHLACRADNTTFRICDRDGILPYKGRQAVQAEIAKLELFNVTCGGGGGAHQVVVVPVQMGVALIRTMHEPFGTNLATAARQKATAIHTAWGVGYPTESCGSSGILLFLAIDDHQVYISRGKALGTLLSSDRLLYIVDKMKPHLRDGQYQQGLILGVQLLTAYIAGERPGFDETMEAVTTLLGILGAFLGCMGCMACIDACHRRRNRRLRRELRQDLQRLDRDRSLALQGKYQCSTSCPICLDDFGDTTTTTTPTNGEGKPLLPHYKDNDGEPLKVLGCGHVFHQTCWDDFSTHRSTKESTEGGLKCPICRRPVDDDSDISRTEAARATLDDAAYQAERRFRLERLQEMYPTFIGTQYVDQWYDPEYRGSLLDDYDTMEREQRAQAEQDEAERNRMFSYDSEDSPPPDFGGGKADGGGEGGTF